MRFQRSIQGTPQDDNHINGGTQVGDSASNEANILVGSSTSPPNNPYHSKKEYKQQAGAYAVC